MKSPSLRRSALLALALHLTGCMTWQPAPKPLRELIAEDRPNSIRVTDTGGGREVVEEPLIRGDSLVSLSLECRTDVTSRQRLCATAGWDGLPLRDIETVEVLRQNTDGTVMAIAAVAGVLVVAFFVALHGCVQDDGCS